MKKSIFFASVIFLLAAAFSFFPDLFGAITYSRNSGPKEIISKEKKSPVIPPLDREIYDQKLQILANNPPPLGYSSTGEAPPSETKIVKNPETGEEETVVVEKPAPTYLWPARHASQGDAGGPVKTDYPRDGAILPFKRIVAYYGNLYSTKMGALGQYPEEEMLSRLAIEVKKWEMTDPQTPVLPALHYIAVVAQGSAGSDGKYRARMPSSEIEKVLVMAEKINAIVFLDIQVGFSTVEKEVPLLEKYLKLPNVHLGIDPEFSMKSGIPPGKIVGTVDATDINFAAEYLAKLVKENNLPPKILVIHRYTQKMVTNYQKITPLPEVQIVMHMDGWGIKAKKINTYKQFIYPEPVQFTGFKLFYKNDTLEPGTSIFTPEELLKLNPRPIYIQYQ